MHAHKFFVRYREYGLRRFRNYEKKFVQVLPKLVTRPQNTNFYVFGQVWGQIPSEGISCTWVLIHMMKDCQLEFIVKKSKLCAGDAQVRYLTWKMKKSEKRYNLIG